MFEIITDTDVAYELDKIFKVKDQLRNTAYSERYDGPSKWIVDREREIYYTCYSNRGGSLESYNLGYDEKPRSATLILEGKKIELYMYIGSAELKDYERLMYDIGYDLLISLMYVPRSLSEDITYILDIFEKAYTEYILSRAKDRNDIKFKVKKRLSGKTTIVYKEEDIF